MNFFKSILSDDPDPPHPHKSKEPLPISSPSPSPASSQESDVETGDAVSATDSSPVAGTSSAATSVGGWSFGGLLKTLAAQSESVLETYRRDLQEFGSGLRKETQLFREVATRAVQDLPASIEVGASVAHGSLESVSHAIDGVIKSTADIISHSKGTAISSSYVEPDTPDTGPSRYSRFNALLNAIQSDMNTFSEKPEDLEDYEDWRSGFSLGDKGEEVENLIGGNGVLAGVYRRIVPNVVDRETFLCRYFYRVHKLKQQEKVRASLVKRAISIDDEEELSWDVDDDDEPQLDNNAKSKGHELEKKALGAKISSPTVEQNSIGDEKQKRSPAVVGKNEENMSASDDVDDKGNVVQSREVIIPDESTQAEGNSSQVKKEDVLVKKDDKGYLDSNGEHCEATKHRDVGSNQQSVHSKEEVENEEDIGWDEIEDIGSGDERKPYSKNQGGSPNIADVRKRLSGAEEDEDLSWDIEDDD